MRAAWQDKKKEKKRRHGSFDLKEMLQACVSLQQPWPCILIYFNTPKGEFFESYIPFLIDAKRVYTWTSQGHSPGWCHLPLQGFGARRGGETSILRPPTTPASSSSREHSCSCCHHDEEWPHICLLVLDSEQNLILIPQSATLFPFRSMEPVSSHCLHRMYIIACGLQSPQHLLWHTEILFLHLRGKRQGHKTDWRWLTVSKSLWWLKIRDYLDLYVPQGWLKIQFPAWSSGNVLD